MSEAPEKQETAAPEQLEVLLDYLNRSRGFDFTGYKRSSLERRITHRMEAVDIESYGEYLDFLEVQPDEFSYLFNTILINVTEFFRDQSTWDYLREEVVPQLVEEAGPDGHLRVWSAACASGQEAFSIAMVLVEAMGADAFRSRVKVYATDVDQEALSQARSAVFTAKEMENVPEQLRERCFERTDQRWTFRPELRRAVIFGRNDLVQDAPISRIDLLLCRNTLMYFNAETQQRVLRRFNFALTERGYLVLGKSEMLLTHSDLFVPVSLKRRVFAKVNRPTLRERLMGFTHDGPGADQVVRMRDSALDAVPLPQVLVDTQGTLVLANERARELLDLAATDLGSPIRDLTLSYRPVDVRSLLETAFAERRSASAERVEWIGSDGQRRVLNVCVTPLASDEGVVGASIVYEDVTAQDGLRVEFESSRRELENAHEELQSAVEELETTNEELQSTNEELETTNEELQSTNEELETMNEELQSTNEELENANDELRVRSGELDEVNSFLEGILTSLGVAVVVIDGHQKIQIWNAASDELWGMRSSEAEGHHLQSLDIGLPLDGLRAPVGAVLAGRSPREELDLEAVNRRGKSFTCRVTALPMRQGDEVTGAMLLMEQVGEEAE